MSHNNPLPPTLHPKLIISTHLLFMQYIHGNRKFSLKKALSAEFATECTMNLSNGTFNQMFFKLYLLFFPFFLAGFPIAKVAVIDPDFNDSFTLKLTPRAGDSWTPENLFDINRNWFVVATAKLNYEERMEYKIKIIATDKGGLQRSRVNIVNSLIVKF